MDYTALMGSVRRTGDGTSRITIPDSWTQGRTAYGGLTAALCLEAARPLSGGRPVRAVQIAFVGPVSGEAASTPELLRAGKNTTFVRVRLTADDGPAAEAILTFGAPRSSALAYDALPAPSVPPPDGLPSHFPDPSRAPAFACNFDMLLAAGPLPLSGSAKADICLWMRHRDRQAGTDPVAMLALADSPPPAAMSMMRTPGAISSMTWMAEFLTDAIGTDDGWFLARHVADSVRDGYASQAMTIWNRAGRPVMTGRQTIAIFA